MTYGLSNNTTSKLTAGIGTTSTSVSITAGEGQLFINNSVATLEHRNSDGDVVKREIVLISNISTDTLTIERAYGPCVIDDTAEDKEMSATAQTFAEGDTISVYLSSEVIQDLYSPADDVATLCTAICCCHDTRLAEVINKICQCYGDISRGSGCDGDCVMESGCYYLDASHEYQFKNLTICSGACVRFVGTGIPRIHVKGLFCNMGRIDLRGGCAVGNCSFTNCLGTISNNYCATCYNAQCYGCGGKGGTTGYTTETDGPRGGDGGNANVSGTTVGTGGTGKCCSTTDKDLSSGCNGGNGGLCLGGGGGGAGAGLTTRGYYSTGTVKNGCNGNGCNGGDGGKSSPACSTTSYDCQMTARAGGGGGGGYRNGCGGNGGIGGNLFTTCSCRGTKTGLTRGGNGGNGGIRGKGGNGGEARIRVSNATKYGSRGCCCNYGGFGGKGGNGFCGGYGGNGCYLCHIDGTNGRTCGGDGGNGVCCGGAGGSVYFDPSSSVNDPISQACAGKGGDAINNMYGIGIRAKCYYNSSTGNRGIIGCGGTGGKGGSVYCCGELLTSGTNIKGGNGGNGGNGANIMIVYECELNKGNHYCAGGTGGTGGCGATNGTNGTNGSDGSLMYCQRT